MARAPQRKPPRRSKSPKAQPKAEQQPEELPKAFIIKQPDAQAIADYLSTRPFREVAGFMYVLHNLKPAPEGSVPKPDPGSNGAGSS